ncbi:hypothetical protein [Listeria seeligeri]|uniref:hypothetical protein n=1 Tax=Listeria seeligeri TaxID=1640 RepID=UPI0016289F87|nr:hypothetical protein [Listeria seeligeri]
MEGLRDYGAPYQELKDRHSVLVKLLEEENRLPVSLQNPVYILAIKRQMEQLQERMDNLH